MVVQYILHELPLFLCGIQNKPSVWIYPSTKIHSMSTGSLKDQSLYSLICNLQEGQEFAELRNAMNCHLQQRTGYVSVCF